MSDGQDKWLDSLSGVQVDPQVATWLQDEGSLTSKLSAHNGAPVRVDVLLQHLAVPSEGERRALALAEEEQAVIREVVLSGHDGALVFARTVIPKASASDSFNFIDGLGDQPLGHWLFQTQGVVRLGMEYTSQGVGQGKHESRWGRRSIFDYQGQRILVAEYFLPALTEAIS